MTVMTAVAQGAWAGASWPLGAHVSPSTGSTTVAVHAPAATRVALESYAEALGSPATAAVEMARGADGAWRAQVDGLGHGSLYAFRCWGRNWPYDPAWEPGSGAGFVSDIDQDGNRFNPNKVLFDPYALEITHAPLDPRIGALGGDGGFWGTGGADYHGRPRREADTAVWAPKGVVVVDTTSPGEHPHIDAHVSAVYEAHVKNLTMHPSAIRLGELLHGVPGFEDVVDIPDELRGTYRAAGMMAPYLKALGLTTIELLPVQETDSNDIGETQGGANHWGYMTMAYFAPNRDYSSDTSWGGPTREFKEMVRAFHEHGLEVYIDVVYNHTAEGGNVGGDPDTTAFTSLGGFAADEYYVTTADHVLLDGATGTANQVNFSSAAACHLVLDSLAYWTDVMGIDGFRFDLAPVLGRTPDDWRPDDWADQKKFFPQHPLLEDIARLGEERNVEVVAEAWDLWGYEVGNFPPGWAEWNGRYRDAVRGFAKGDGNVQALMDMVNGDYRHFADQGGPQRSINFVTAHDGFTMMDLVSFNTKQNDQPFPFGPSDGGADDNTSWDSGGDHALRRTRWRNFWTLLFLSRGVPMVVSGDEYGRTQNGNNNPWALNTVGMWNNWAQAVSEAPTQLPVDPRDPGAYAYYDVVGRTDAPAGTNPLFTFAANVANLRRVEPALRQRNWGDTEADNGDVSYLFRSPDLGQGPGENARALSLGIDGSSAGGSDYLVMVNMDDRPRTFQVAPDGAGFWRRLVDTAPWAEPVGNHWDPEAADVIHEGEYVVHPWSIAVLRHDGEHLPDLGLTTQISLSPGIHYAT
ncbi:glycogen operon protein [Raineyella antarctica]|uniref:Glycogen operon protein n=1 Tax=Raineyella antarctica TaxID=1577474 RepID=A0A1G6GD88_9ACTN|nr:alpha-amylase family glycosyl hydrolase [Raineyella antarctica]SDB79930.1 glycogen operon protein [Raineyella antarctica]